MRKKILLAILLSVFLLSAITVPSLSQDVTVGVSVGDWFKYETRILEWIAEPDVPFPPDQYVEFLYTYNETDWQKLTVTDIAGSNVTFDVLLHWKNGTETTYELETNITSSQTPPEVLTVVPANLEAGDQVKPELTLFGAINYPPRYINETILVDYETGTRETNVLDYDHPTLLPAASIHSTQLWDKETGVLVKNRGVFLNNTSMLTFQDYSATYEVELVETNLWECAQPQEWTVGVSVGDTFRYKGTLVSWESESASFPPMSSLEYLQTWNESDWLEYKVTDIEELIVTFEVTTHWKNGTETVDTLEENMTSTIPIAVIGANLAEGTEIRPETTFFGQPMPARCLNASIMREYESGPKETNVMIWDWNFFDVVYHYEYLFDKETGIKVYFQSSATDAFDTSGNPFSYNCTLELIETNVEGWTVIPEFPTGTVMLLIFVTVTVCVSIYRRKKLKHHTG